MPNQTVLTLQELAKILNRSAAGLSRYDLPFAMNGKRKVYDLFACRSWLEMNVRGRKKSDENTPARPVECSGTMLEIPIDKSPHDLFWDAFSRGSDNLSHVESLDSRVFKSGGASYSVDCTIVAAKAYHPDELREMAGRAATALWVLINSGFLVDRFSIAIEGFSTAVPIDDNGNLVEIEMPAK